MRPTQLEGKRNPYKQLKIKKLKKPLKRSPSGYEVEYMVLNNDGYVTQKGSDMIDAVKKEHPKICITKEAGKHMIEMQSLPNVKIQDTALNLLNNFEKVEEIAQKKELIIFPYATYPGRFNTELVADPYYNRLYNILGVEHAKNVLPLMCGFHYHYALPRGVFDPKTLFLKRLIKSKLKQTLIDSHNMMVAMDPVVTTLLQSSPFFNGKYVAKDSRMLLFRGGNKLRYNGVFHKFQSLAGLQPYKQTLTDLIQSLKNKDNIWKKKLRRAGYGDKEVNEKKMLDCNWCPVKINKVGTLEQRGMDVNKLKYLIPVSLIIKSILKSIHRDFLHAMPSDIGIDEPFKSEGNIIYIPPHTHVRNRLQYDSAYYGFDNKEIYKYCSRLIKLARSNIEKRYGPLLRPILERFNEKQTVSDILIKRFKRKGYGKQDYIPNEVCAEVALKSSEHFLKEIDIIKKTLINLD